MIRFLALAFLILATPARAQVELGEYTSFRTRFGSVAVFQVDEWMRGFVWNGVRIAGIEDRFLSVAGAWGRAEEEFDWVLLSVAHSGNMCPQRYVLAKVSAAGLQRTAQFGSCIGPVEDIRVEPGRIELDLGNHNVTIARTTFVYDGASLTETNVAQVDQGVSMPGAGPDVTRWVGRHPADVFRDAGERVRFGQIMTAAQMQEVNLRLGPAGPVTQDGGWVLAKGCQAHACNMAGAFWAMEIATGRAVAGIHDRDRPIIWYGGSVMDVPPQVQFLAYGMYVQ